MHRARILRGAVIVGLILSCSSVARAQSPQLSTSTAPILGVNQLATAAVTFSSGASLKLRAGEDGNFPLVAVASGETINIQIRLPASFAKSALVAQALDGGTIPAGQQDSKVVADGTATIQFQAPNDPGLYRILLNSSGISATLSFWVAGAQNESPNAAALKP